MFGNMQEWLDWLGPSWVYLIERLGSGLSEHPLLINLNKSLIEIMQR